MQSRIVMRDTLIDRSDQKIGISQVRSVVLDAGRPFLLVIRRKRRSSIILKEEQKRQEIRAEFEYVVTCLPSWSIDRPE